MTNRMKNITGGKEISRVITYLIAGINCSLKFKRILLQLMSSAYFLSDN